MSYLSFIQVLIVLNPVIAVQLSRRVVLMSSKGLHEYYNVFQKKNTNFLFFIYFRSHPAGREWFWQ